MKYFLLACLGLLLAYTASIGLARVVHRENRKEPNPEYGDEWEGDILLPPWQTEAELNNVSPLNAIWDKSKKWTAATLYYEVREDYDNELMALLDAGIEDLMESVKVNGELCINILPREGQSNYVYIVDGGCSSYIGMIGGGQRMRLSPRCLDRHGTIMHEFIHAFGFHHEQKRSDRDEYVTINWDNIEEGKENNFRKLVENVTVDLLGTAYDYGSIMHYSESAFSIDDDIPTIIPHDPNAEIGQRVALSDLDRERIQILYGCLQPEDSRYFKHLAGKKFMR